MSDSVISDAATLAHRSSRTAQLAALCRASFHRDGQFDDPLARRFLTPRFRAMLALRPLARPMLQRRMPGTYAFMLARSRFFERSLRQALADGCAQVVFLGAGFDTRPYRLSFGAATVFEVDTPTTSAKKQALVRAVLGAAPPHVRYVPVSFATESLPRALAQAGYRPELRTHFVWEGVTFYLDEAAVTRVLGLVRAAAADSDLTFDHLYDDVPAGDSPRYGARQGAAFIRRQGEPFRWGIAEGGERALLEAHGLSLEERLGPEEMDELVRRDGLNERVSGMYGLLRARVP